MVNLSFSFRTPSTSWYLLVGVKKTRYDKRFLGREDNKTKITTNRGNENSKSAMSWRSKASSVWFSRPLVTFCSFLYGSSCLCFSFKGWGRTRLRLMNEWWQPCDAFNIRDQMVNLMLDEGVYRMVFLLLQHQRPHEKTCPIQTRRETRESIHDHASGHFFMGLWSLGTYLSVN